MFNLVNIGQTPQVDRTLDLVTFIYSVMFVGEGDVGDLPFNIMALNGLMEIVRDVSVQILI